VVKLGKCEPDTDGNVHKPKYRLQVLNSLCTYPLEQLKYKINKICRRYAPAMGAKGNVNYEVMSISILHQYLFSRMKSKTTSSAPMIFQDGIMEGGIKFMCHPNRFNAASKHSAVWCPFGTAQ
jgi:hypothetical protein